MRFLAAAICALALASCSSEQTFGRSAAPEAAMDAPANAYMADAVSGDKAAAPAEAAPSDGRAAPAAPNQPAKPPGGPLLAYVYGATLEAPAKAVRPLMMQHEKACRAAGPQVCQVLGANVNVASDEEIYASLELRAEPKWLQSFRDGLEGQAEKAGGRVKETTSSTEDLTRAITDTEARLRAQKTLRDRLQQLLRDRPAKLAELLETERELARVIGDIDSMESNLAVMRERVNMSLLNLDYRSRGVAVAGGTFDPIIDAFNDFIALIAMVIGFLIRAVAVLAPLALFVVLPIVWWLRRRAKLRRAREESAKAGF